MATPLIENRLNNTRNGFGAHSRPPASKTWSGHQKRANFDASLSLVKKKKKTKETFFSASPRSARFVCAHISSTALRAVQEGPVTVALRGPTPITKN
jgi:hypothetical protein